MSNRSLYTMVFALTKPWSRAVTKVPDTLNKDASRRLAGFACSAINERISEKVWAGVERPPIVRFVSGPYSWRAVSASTDEEGTMFFHTALQRGCDLCGPAFCEIIVIAMRNHNQAIQIPSPKLACRASYELGCRTFVMSRRSAGPRVMIQSMLKTVRLDFRRASARSIHRCPQPANVRARCSVNGSIVITSPSRSSVRSCR